MAVPPAPVPATVVDPNPDPDQFPGSTHGTHQPGCSGDAPCYYCNVLGVGSSTNTDTHKMPKMPKTSKTPTVQEAAAAPEVQLPEGVCHTLELDGTRAIDTTAYLQHHEAGSEEAFSIALDAVHHHNRLRRLAADDVVRAGYEHPYTAGFGDLRPIYDEYVAPHGPGGSEEMAIFVEGSPEKHC